MEQNLITLCALCHNKQHATPTRSLVSVQLLRPLLELFLHFSQLHGDHEY